MSVSNNSQPIGIQSFTHYLSDLADKPSYQLENKVLQQLGSLGLESFLLQSTHSSKINDKSSVDEEVVLLGISGRICKRVMPLISSTINQKLTEFDEKHKHLVVLLGDDAVIEFGFYKFLNDLIVGDHIQSLTLFSKTLDRSIELGIEFIQNFTSKSKIKYTVNSSLPVNALMDSYSLPLHVSSY